MIRLASFILRLSICAAAIVLIARTVSISELMHAIDNANQPLLFCGLATFLLTPVLQGVRLRRLLEIQGVHVSGHDSVGLAFAGNLLNFAAPIGSTSGDFYKAVFLGRRARQGWEAAATVFVDRGIGLATLLFSVAAIALLAGPNCPLANLRLYLALLSLAVLAAGGLVLILPLLRRTALRSRIDRLPGGEKLRRIVSATRILLASPRALLLAVVDTLGIQIAAAAAFLCIALAFGFRIEPRDWTALYAYFSAGEIVKALPGPPQGLGTMEVAYTYFFEHWAGHAQILTAALGVRAVALACSLPGAAFVLHSHLNTSAKPAIPAIAPHAA